MIMVPLTWIYGVLAIASLFITAGMAKMWVDQMDDPPERRSGSYQAILIYGGMHGIGGALWWSVRTFDALVHSQLYLGTTPALILTAATLYVVGKGGLVFATSINGKPYIWRTFLGVCVLWSIVVWWSVLA